MYSVEIAELRPIVIDDHYGGLCRFDTFFEPSH